MIIPRVLIDDNYLFKDKFAQELQDNPKGFEYKLYKVLAEGNKWFQKSQEHTVEAFLDGYYIVKLILMHPHPEYWCDDFYRCSGMSMPSFGEYKIVKERQIGVMSFVYCVLSKIEEVKNKTEILKYRIRTKLIELQAEKTLDMMLQSIEEDCKHHNCLRFVTSGKREDLSPCLNEARLLLEGRSILAWISSFDCLKELHRVARDAD